ncbi:MAG: anti-sigma factor [Egibacteraceae bacterium]
MTDHAHVLAGAYALDALPDDERAFFSRHLAVCPACRVDVDGYLETAGLLAQVVARTPPTSLRTGVLDAAAGIRQDSSSSPRSGRRGLPDRLRPQLAAVAGLLVAALLSLGGLSVYLHETPRDAAAVAIAPEFLAVAQAVPLDAPEGVEVTFLHAADEGYLVATGLDELGTAGDYQLWLFHDGVPVPAGVFDVGAERTAVQVQAPVRGAELIAVTAEPDGGRAAPSGPVLFSAPL